MTKNTKKRSGGFWRKIIELKWYKKLVLSSAIVLMAFFLFKLCVNTYNISLLNKAEAKIRELNLPPADRTSYSRSCSFRSVKFGGAGSPNCDISRTDTFFNKNMQEGASIGKAYLAEFSGLYPGMQSNFKTTEGFIQSFAGFAGSNPSVREISLQKGLKCYTNFGFFEKEKNRTDLVATISCYKEFLFQTYPEL